MTPTQSRYCAEDRKLFVAYDAIQHFHSMLEGRPFSLFSNHKHLISALNRPTARLSHRQTRRHLSYIDEMTNDVQHTPGKDNAVAYTYTLQVFGLCHQEERQSR